MGVPASASTSQPTSATALASWLHFRNHTDIRWLTARDRSYAFTRSARLPGPCRPSGEYAPEVWNSSPRRWPCWWRAPHWSRSSAVLPAGSRVTARPPRTCAMPSRSRSGACPQSRTTGRSACRSWSPVPWGHRRQARSSARRADRASTHTWTRVLRAHPGPPDHGVPSLPIRYSSGIDIGAPHRLRCCVDPDRVLQHAHTSRLRSSPVANPRKGTARGPLPRSSPTNAQPPAPRAWTLPDHARGRPARGGRGRGCPGFG